MLFDRAPFSYMPGQPLADYELAFDRAPGANKGFEVAQEGYRFRESQCFQQSAGKLRCTSCHNPHDIPRGEQATLHYNGVCLGCHATGASHPMSTLASQPSHNVNANCVSCHMPKRRTEDVVHAVMTDHLIQRRPAANLLAEFPERHGLGLEYRGEVVPYGDQDDLYTAIAQNSRS